MPPVAERRADFSVRDLPGHVGKSLWEIAQAKTSVVHRLAEVFVVLSPRLLFPLHTMACSPLSDPHRLALPLLIACDPVALQTSCRDSECITLAVKQGRCFCQAPAVMCTGAPHTAILPELW